MDDTSFTKMLFSCLLALILLSIFIWTSGRLEPQLPNQIYSHLEEKPYHVAKLDDLNPVRSARCNSRSNGSDLAKPINIGQQKEVRILCWIMSGNSATNVDKVAAIIKTWAPRFDKFLIVKDGHAFKEDANLLTVPLAREGRDMLWTKVIGAFTHVHKHYLDDFDWFMKADDDTYVLVDALKRFLADKDPSHPVYFGHKFKPYVKQGYMSGGSGYVLSREALRRFIELGVMAKKESCLPRIGTPEDVQIGKCLAELGVESGDSRDSSGRPSFNPLNPEYLLSTNENDTSFWYFSYNYYNVSLGKDCCSTNPISFHYVSPREMILLDWLTYDVRPQRERLRLN